MAKRKPTYDYFMRNINLTEVCQELMAKGVPKSELSEIADHALVGFIPGTRQAKISQILGTVFIIFFGCICYLMAVGMVEAIFGPRMNTASRIFIYSLLTLATICGICALSYGRNMPMMDAGQYIKDPHGDHYGDQYQMFKVLANKYSQIIAF